MRSERGGLLLGSRQEQVADRAEEWIDAIAVCELVPVVRIPVMILPFLGSESNGKSVSAPPGAILHKISGHV